MKVTAKFTDGSSHCPGFEEGREYTAFDFFEVPPDCNFLYSYGRVVIDNDGDAITERDAKQLWNVEFEEVME